MTKAKKVDKTEEVEEAKNESTTKKTAPKKTTSKTAPKKTTPKKKVENKAKKTVEKITQSVAKPVIRKQRDMNEMISVVCITNTTLVYESKNQIGHRVDWDGFLQDNWIEYKELINMRNSQRAFFEQPWVICDWDVLVDLKVDHYYKNIIDLEDLDSVFQKTSEELEKTLKIVPTGIRKLIVDRAFELRRDKELDSLSTIETIEKTLNIDLTI